MRVVPILLIIALMMFGASGASNRARKLSRMQSENEFVLERVVKVPEYCRDYYQSTAAKWRPGFLGEELADYALEAIEGQRTGKSWYDSESYQKRRDSIFRVVEEQYSNHICNADEFAPNVLRSSQELPCLEICQQCVPGSIPLCFLRNPNFAGMAQVCLCTYDPEDPVEQAAFSIRHEKRIFSRRIRARYEK